jgi:hypothetical protein
MDEKSKSSIKSGKDLAERLKKDPKSISIGFATTLGSHNHLWADDFVPGERFRKGSRPGLCRHESRTG